MHYQNRNAVDLAGPAERNAAGTFSPLHLVGQTFARGSEAQQRMLIAAMLGGMALLSLAGRAQQGDNGQASLPPSQIITAIQAATTSTPGKVLKAEAQARDGKFYCDVQVLASDGKTRTVRIDVASNKVIAPGEDTPERKIQRRQNAIMSEAAVLAWPSA
jgi:uncharacterized membrane protein YkoI